jgi:triacylglycerol lipase
MVYSHSWDAAFNPGKANDFFQDKTHQPFQENICTFNTTNAWWLSEFSRLIYARADRGAGDSNQTTVRNRFLHPVGFEEHWFYNGRYVQCAIIQPLAKRKRSYSILVFRGTKRGFSNWKFLLNFSLSSWPAGGRVHHGFKRVMLQAWEEILPQLNTLAGPCFYTGHSLGGALAVLTATLKKPDAVYTFGAPRIGDSAFLEATRQVNIYRLFNAKDIVASIPPIPGILHVGKPLLMSGGKDEHGPRFLRDAPVFLSDHSCSNYSFRIAERTGGDAHPSQSTLISDASTEQESITVSGE